MKKFVGKHENFRSDKNALPRVTEFGGSNVKHRGPTLSGREDF